MADVGPDLLFWSERIPPQDAFSNGKARWVLTPIGHLLSWIYLFIREAG